MLVSGVLGRSCGCHLHTNLQYIERIPNETAKDSLSTRMQSSHTREKGTRIRLIEPDDAATPNRKAQEDWRQRRKKEGSKLGGALELIELRLLMGVPCVELQPSGQQRRGGTTRCSVPIEGL